MLTGPLFMLQVYDRVLGSRSEETLVALALLVVFLYGAQALLDHARGRVLARVGDRLVQRLEGPVFAADLDCAAASSGSPGPGGLAALEALRRLLASPLPAALLDLAATPLFIAGLFLFHVALGWLGVAGCTTLLVLATANQISTRRAAHTAAAAARAAERAATHFLEEAAALRGLGMADAARARWQALRLDALGSGAAAADRAGGFAAATRALRLLLQSAVLALGAWLVLAGAITAGAMVAASILLGRALAPVEIAVGQWEVAQRGLAGWRTLAGRTGTGDVAARPTRLPRPPARLEVEGLVLVPPGARQPVLRGVSFSVAPGQAMAVIGPSGAGKSSLARALTGIWPPAAGSIRLGGVALDRYDPALRGRLVGYLPQRTVLFEGTVAENIARFEPHPVDGAIVGAAEQAEAHALIANLPAGYETPLGPGGAALSGGQAQRISLARALYGDPVLVILDEPEAGLDAAGSAALGAAVRALKAAGRAVVVMAHRAAVIRDCELVLVLEGGAQRAFGPRDPVLRATVATPRRAAGPLAGDAA